MNQQLLATRLKCPQPRRNFIRREALFQKLHTIKAHKLTVITGGAGSGKTTLLASYIRTEHPDPVHWLSLDPHSDQPLLFWSYMLEALADVSGDSREAYLNYFHANAKEERITELLIPLLNAMSDAEEIWLVLDDFHLIHNEVILDSLTWFLDNAADSFHLILLTREQPPLYLAKYEMDGTLLRISEPELLLSPAEAGDFLTSTLHLSLPARALSQLTAQAEGWIGGLQLLAASLDGKQTDEISDARFPDRLLTDYLTREIFEKLSNEEQTFLIYTAPLSYLSADLSEALLPGLCYEKMMERLLMQNLMIQCLDDVQNIYRCHNLMREFFLQHFSRLKETLQQSIHRTAAAVLARTGDHEQALYHLQQLGDYPALMEALLAMPQDTVTFSYIADIPVETARDNIEFLVQKFFYHYGIYDNETCARIYESIEDRIKTDPACRVFINAPVLFYAAPISPGYQDITVTEAERHFRYPLTRAQVYAKNAAFLHYTGELEKAITYAALSARICSTMKSSQIYYFALTSQIQIYEEIGLLNKALAIHQETVALLEQYPLLHSLYATHYVTIIGIWLKQMNLKEAQATLTQCLPNLQGVSAQMALSYQYNKAEYLYLSGQEREAGELLEAMLPHDFFASLLSCASLLKHYWRNGQMPAAMLQQYLDICHRADAALPYNARLLQIYLLHATGQRDQAMTMADELLRTARGQKRPLKTVEGALLKLYLLKSTRPDQQTVLMLYQEAICSACEHSIRLPFYFEKSTIQWLVHEYGSSLAKDLPDKERQFHLEILKLCTRSNPLLSDRELEVLLALADGLTNKAIGEELCISLATVKTHILNIYRKLDVNSRVTAVEKARSLGILE